MTKFELTKELQGSKVLLPIVDSKEYKEFREKLEARLKILTSQEGSHYATYPRMGNKTFFKVYDGEGNLIYSFFTIVAIDLREKNIILCMSEVERIC